jgi:phosphinothricin acetyltransferase
MSDVIIREAKLEDVKDLVDIYAYYVKDTAITFEYEVPSLEEFSERMRHINEKYPYFVIEENGQILGYSYAHEYYGRAAYDWCVEMTIYLRKDAKGRGLGKLLYTKMEQALKMMNIKNLYSCIATVNRECPFLTNASVYFHKALGFKKCAQFDSCGYKFGQWFDMIWMVKIIGDHEKNPQKVKKFSELIDFDF